VLSLLNFKNLIYFLFWLKRKKGELMVLEIINEKHIDINSQL
jgi:hypothetical protein